VEPVSSSLRRCERRADGPGRACESCQTGWCTNAPNSSSWVAHVLMTARHDPAVGSRSYGKFTAAIAHAKVDAVRGEIDTPPACIEPQVAGGILHPELRHARDNHLSGNAGGTVTLFVRRACPPSEPDAANLLEQKLPDSGRAPRLPLERASPRLYVEPCRRVVGASSRAYRPPPSSGPWRWSRTNSDPALAPSGAPRSAGQGQQSRPTMNIKVQLTLCLSFSPGLTAALTTTAFDRRRLQRLGSVPVART
jgi:hypothetical protein